jgi:chromosomal replication initiation ATPase DnaA
MSVHVEPMNMNPWDQIKRELESALTAESYNNWVRQTRFGLLDKDRLMVYVPDEATKTWLDSEYFSQIHAIVRALHLP